MLIDVVKAFIIGICASAVPGPILILVIQKTISKGRLAGFASGLGACLVDTVFSVIAIFAWAFASGFVSQNENIILLAGGVIVTILGIIMLFSNPFNKMKVLQKPRKTLSFKDFLQSLIMGFSNPGAIFLMFALFAFFGIGTKGPGDWSVAPIIIAVSAGAVSYWFIITWLFAHFFKNVQMRTMLWVTRIAGVIIIIIGLAFLGEGVFNMIFVK